MKLTEVAVSAAAVRPGAYAAPPQDELATALREHPEFAEAVKADDPKRMIAALLRAGCPDTYLRDMVTFHINDSLTPEKLALLRHQAEKPFWKTLLNEEGRALQRSLAEVDAKNTALAKEVFGGKVPPHPLEALNQQHRYQFLPAEKAEAVARIDSDYAELEAESRRASTGADFPGKARLLQQEKRADVEKLLTPQELERYDLTFSSTAESIRRSLALFQPTEEEFRQLFEIRRVFDQKYLSVHLSTNQALLRDRAADQKVLDDQVRVLLGEQRFAEYRRAQDSGYRAAFEIVKHFKLPEANAVETYALQQSVRTRAQEISRAVGADSAALAAEIGKLVDETNGRLTQLLGGEGMDAYRKTAGLWLESLERAAATTVATPPRE